MGLFVGLDVSLRSVSVCIVAADGKIVREGKAASEQEAMIKTLAPRRHDIELIGIEACPLSEWLYGALVESGFVCACIEARHANRFLSSRPNKTDRSDARGIADMMRIGHFRPVHVKSVESQLVRTVLVARKTFVEHMIAIEQSIRGLLRAHGRKVGAVHRCAFAARVESLLEDAPRLRPAIAPLLEARNMMRRQKASIDRELSRMARKDEVCKRPDDHLGRGPNRQPVLQGHHRRSVAISIIEGRGGSPWLDAQDLPIGGDGSIRSHQHGLYEAANSHLRISKKWSTLKVWGMQLAKRVGIKKALVAVARKLAIIMHRMWVTGTEFRFGAAPAPAGA